jgi:hypothetical protein
MADLWGEANLIRSEHRLVRGDSNLVRPVTMGVRVSSNQMWPKTIHQARKLIILVVGMTLLLCGGIMLITPGPGLLLILSGLSVLAIEFVWARRLLRKIKSKGNELRRSIFDSCNK